MSCGHPHASRVLRNIHPAFVALVVATALTPGVARSQLYIGDTVRLSVANVQLRRGAFVRADSEAVYLRVAGAPDPYRTAYSDYTRAEVLLGRHPAGGKAVSLGAVLGVGIGAALGLTRVLGPALGGSSGPLTSAAVGALVGGAGGAIVGSVAAGSNEEVWRAVDIRPLAIRQALAAAAASARDTFASIRMAGTLVMSRPMRAPGVVSMGDTVRLLSGRTILAQGILASADSDALVVIPDGMSDPTRYPRERITLAEVRRGERRRGAKALAVGTLIGAGVGTALLVAGANDKSSQSDGIGAAIGFLLGVSSTVLGTAIGGVVAVTYTDRWIRFDTMTLSMVPDEG